MANGEQPRRISLIGAESSGKTTLACALADRLPGLWVPELLREFCDLHGRPPRGDEQGLLMSAQIAREAQMQAVAHRQGLGFVVCDSSPLATALYSAELFGDVSLLEEAIEHQRGYALTLFTAIDIPWQADGIQRDGPQARERFDTRLRARARCARTCLQADRRRSARTRRGRARRARCAGLRRWASHIIVPRHARGPVQIRAHS